MNTWSCLYTYLCVWIHRFVVSLSTHSLVRTFLGARNKKLTMKLLMKKRKRRKRRKKKLPFPISLRHGGCRCSSSTIRNLLFSTSEIACSLGQCPAQACFLLTVVEMVIRHSKLSSLVHVIFEGDRSFHSSYIESLKRFWLALLWSPAHPWPSCGSEE